MGCRRPAPFCTWPLLSAAVITAALLGLAASLSDKVVETKPVVIWHGLGGSYDDKCTSDFIDMIREEAPFIHIISVRIGEDSSTDAYRSYFDDANRQVQETCDKLSNDPRLANGFHAMGLSQGGLLMRALVERCSNLKVLRLITVGSPLQGVEAYPGCGVSYLKWNSSGIIRALFQRSKVNLIPCSVLTSLIGSAVYQPAIQSSVMPAQYFKDPAQMPAYLASSTFLADINNERAVKNESYRQNFLRLQQLVIFHYEDEEVVHPAESSNFGFTDGSRIIPMRETQLYKEDWIGLRELDERGGVVQIKIPGNHLYVDRAIAAKIAIYLS